MMACEELLAGRLSLMKAAAVGASQDPFTQIVMVLPVKSTMPDTRYQVLLDKPVADEADLSVSVSVDLASSFAFPVAPSRLSCTRDSVPPFLETPTILPALPSRRTQAWTVTWLAPLIQLKFPPR